VLYRFENVVKRFGPREVLKGASWQHNPGEKVGLIGRNGAGKTTLLRLVLGREETDSGRVLRASGIRIGSVDQSLDASATAGAGETLENYVAGAFEHLHRIEAEMRELEQRLAETGADHDSIAHRYDRLQHRFETEGGYAMHAEVERMLSGLGFDAGDFRRPMAELSGGQKNRAMLCRALLGDPDVLLLDEPTNHLDYSGMEFLEEHLRQSRRAFLVVSHDRRFLNRVCTTILDLEFGRLTEYPGNYDAYRVQKAERILAATRAYEKQRDYIEKTEEFIRRNIAGQKTKQARGRRTHLEKIERLDKPTEDGTEVAFQFQADKKGGRTFLRVRRLDAGYEIGRPIVRGVDFELFRGERLAILGENGCGKSTLLKTLAGRLPPLEGTVELGHDVSAGYYDQELRDLDPKKRAIDAIWDLHRTETELQVRSYLALFDFREEEVFAPIAGLSGGEKGRLSLAVVMKQNHNLLLLDEPTNHLDLEAREALEESLEAFPGSIVFVSHDRAFVDRIATRVLDIDRGRPRLMEGNYSETAEERRARRREPVPAQTPKPAPPVKTPEAKRPAEGRGAKKPAEDRGERKPAEDREARKPAEGREARKNAQRVLRLEKRISELEAEVSDRESRLYEEGDKLDALTAARIWKEKEEARKKLEELVEEWSELAAAVGK
jgi:ATP-binding cassette subfamily F protein 3